MADSTFIWRTRTGSPRRIVWASSTHGYLFWTDNSGGAPSPLVYSKTVDAGVTWSTGTIINSPTGRNQFFSIWADWWTPGYECSPYIHIAVLNAGGPSLEYQRLNINDDCQWWPFGKNLGVGITGGIGSGTAPSNIDILRSRAGNLHIAFWNIHVLGHTFRHLVSTGIEETTQAWRDLDSTSIFSPIQGSQIRANRFIFQPGDQNTSADFLVFDWNSTEAAVRRGVFDFDSTAGTSTRLGLITDWVKVSCNNAPVLGNVNQSWDVANRHQDGKSLVIVRKGFDSADATYEFWEVGSTDITKKTDPATGDDQIDCSLTIVNNSYWNDTAMADTTNPHIYAHILGTSTEVVVSNVRPRYYLSTDGGGSWTTQGGILITDDTGANFQTIHGSYGIGGKSGRGGQVAAFWGINSVGGYQYRTNSTHYVGVANTTGDCSFFPLPTTTDAGGGVPGAVSPSIIVDFNADGDLLSTEDIASHVMRMFWTRGAEPEADNTPAGTLTVQLKDPNGIFVPDSTEWGAGNIQPGRQIRATLTYAGTEYTVFRGRVQRWSPSISAGEQTAEIFAVDEKEELKKTVIHFPHGPATTGLASSTGDRPMQLYTVGGATGILGHALDESSLLVGRRNITELGTTLDNWWNYNTNMSDLIDELERHDRGRIFFNSSGSITFHDFTHREGSAVQFTFTGFSFLNYQKSARDVKNRAIVTTHGRDAGAAAVLGSADPGSLPTIASGSTFTTIIEFTSAPVWNVVTPPVEPNSTRGVSAVGAGGTSYTSTSVGITGRVLGASAIEIKITNNSAETITIKRPELASDTTIAIPVTGTLMTDTRQTSTAQAPAASIAKYGLRTDQQEYDFISGLGRASQRATDLITNTSTSHMAGIRMGLEASDSDNLTQLLAREIDDRIAVTSTKFALSAKNFYITQGEWELAPGGFLTGVYTLQEAT